MENIPFLLPGRGETTEKDVLLSNTLSWSKNIRIILRKPIEIPSQD